MTDVYPAGMLARLQKTTTLLQVSLAMAWLAACALSGSAPGLYAIALLAIYPHAFILGAEYVVLHAIHRGDGVARASAGRMARAWWQEVHASQRVFNWRQPFRSRLCPDDLAADGGRPVIFVHGLVCNRGFWLPLLREMRSRRIPYAAVDLEPVFADSIDDYVDAVQSAVARAVGSTGLQPLIVAHSMGGLVVRAWLARRAAIASQEDPPVHHVITIGSPHRGTWLARWGRKATIRQMRMGSSWLQELQRRERRPVHGRCASVLTHRLYTCFYSDCDNIVMPPFTATLPGASNRLLTGSPHIGLAFRPEVLDEILRRQADAGPSLSDVESPSSR